MRNLVATTHATVRAVKQRMRKRLINAMSWLAVENTRANIPR